jgi:hypothetical protein
MLIKEKEKQLEQSFYLRTHLTAAIALAVCYSNCADPAIAILAC